MIGALGLINKGMEKFTQQIPATSKLKSYRRSHYCTWNITYPKKGTIHQIDFYLILTLGPRNGPGYYVVLWHEVKGNNNNDDDDDGGDDDDDDNNNYYNLFDV